MSSELNFQSFVAPHYFLENCGRELDTAKCLWPASKGMRSIVFI